MVVHLTRKELEHCTRTMSYFDRQVGQTYSESLVFRRFVNLTTKIINMDETKDGGLCDVLFELTLAAHRDKQITTEQYLDIINTLEKCFDITLTIKGDSHV